LVRLELRQHVFHPAACECEFVVGDGERNHHFDDRLIPLAHHLLGGFHQCSNLHGVQTRLDDPESHTTCAQHRVYFGPRVSGFQELLFFGRE